MGFEQVFEFKNTVEMLHKQYMLHVHCDPRKINSVVDFITVNNLAYKQGRSHNSIFIFIVPARGMVHLQSCSIFKNHVQE